MNDVSNNSILIVDDVPENIDILVGLLSSSYTISAARSGEIALKIIRSSPPDLILLDILMPEMDGYEVCKQLRSDPITETIPVVFVSAADSIEERLKGYDVGGDDYVVKPFNSDELIKKINVLLHHKNEVEKLASNASEAMKVAMVAMTSAGELGNVLDFLSKSFTCHSSNELAKAMLDNLYGNNLHCAVQIRQGNNKINMSNNGIASPLEVAVIDKLKDIKRIYDFGSRTVINYPHVSLLIKNMPVDDPDLYGRIKDNIAILVEGAEERIKAIAIEEEVKDKQESLQRIVLMTEQALSEIDARNKEHKLASTQIMENLLREIEEAFLRLGLTEEQELEMISMANRNVEKALSLYEEGLGVDEHLFAVMEQLQKSVSV
ncbi:MAG: response regulator [Gammaproteobacteria bacterium]|nr:response regulator [Gammaproteobacteria bacterium]